MQNVGSYGFLAEKHQQDQIHIAADNDLSFEAGSWIATQTGARQLASEGITPIVTQPDTIKGKKTDYNDVLQRYGKTEIAKQFTAKFTIDCSQPITDKTTLQPIINETHKSPAQLSDAPSLYQIPESIAPSPLQPQNIQKSQGELGER